MKSYKDFITEEKKLYRVSYDGRYEKIVSASSPEEAISIRDAQQTMKNKKKNMKFSKDKYKAIAVK